MTIFWISFNVFVLAMLALDLCVVHRSACEVKPREALGWSLLWVCLALAFALGLFIFQSQQASLEFLAGYAVEKSLSIDNIFVFSVIFQSFSIPLHYQHRVLFWGILGALVLRALMIWFGIALITWFHPIIYVLGVFLILAGLKMLWAEEKPLDATAHPAIVFLQRFMPVTLGIEGQHLFVRIGQPRRWHATPLFIALVIVECSDLLFALDSIPAIFAITLDPFIVYTSNVFAILGLRSLYFLLAGAIKKFVYLKAGVALILCFVGLKILVADIYKISTLLSLFIILFLLGGSILLSSTYGRRPCRK